MNSNEHQLKITGNIITGVLASLAIYVFTALVLYQIRSRRKCSIMMSLHICTALFVALAILFGFLYSLFSHNDLACRAGSKLSVVFYFVAMLATFTLIWFRQRSLYSDSLSKSYYSKRLRVFSVLTISAIYVILISVSIFFLYFVERESTGSECEIVIKTFKPLIIIFLGTFGLFAVIFQVLLLVLMILPLLKATSHKKKSVKCKSEKALEGVYEIKSNCNHRLSRETTKNLTPTCEVMNTKDIESSSWSIASLTVIQKTRKKHQCKEKGLFALMRRLIICTSICVISEIVTGVTIAISVAFDVGTFWVFMVHSDLLINIIALTFVFVNWKTRLFPFALFKNKQLHWAVFN